MTTNCKHPSTYIKSSNETRVGNEIWLIATLHCSICHEFVKFDVMSRRKA